MSLPILFAAILLGPLAHWGAFIHGEWHMQATSILLTHGGLYGAVCSWMLFVDGKSMLQALSKSTLFACFYLLSLFTSILTYRLCFHRLCGFPGPYCAGASKLWHAWKGRRSQNHLLLDKLHKLYGDFVRSGPSELTVFDASAFVAVNGKGTKCTKNEWYDFMQPNYSIISSRDSKEHDTRRRIWSQALSINALKQYEGSVLKNVDKVERYIDKHAGKVVDVKSLCYWFAFDVMGEFAFGESFGMLDDERYHYIIIMLRRAFQLLGPFSPVPWLARIAFGLFPRFWLVGEWTRMLKYCHQRMEERVKVDVQRPDISSYLIKDAAKHGFTERDRKYLNGDAVTVIIGGSNSSAPTLVFILYCLAKHPEHIAKIFNELADVDIRDSKGLQDLKHLGAVINETLRLYPALPTAVTRKTPAEGIHIADQFIPGDTTIVVPRYTIGRRECYFKEPDAFVPERWYSKPEMVKDHRAHVPFSLGKSSCIGKDLALMDIKLVISAIIKHFDIQLPPGHDSDRVHREIQDHFTAVPGPLHLIFKKRSSK